MRKPEESQMAEELLVKKPCARAPHKQQAWLLKRQTLGTKTPNGGLESHSCLNIFPRVEAISAENVHKAGT